jgi:hypothetical protein
MYGVKKDHERSGPEDLNASKIDLLSASGNSEMALNF